MRYYTIKWESEIPDARKRFELRKANLKVTQPIPIVIGSEIDPYYIDCVYYIQSSILIWLN
jgi:hypothetical protein